MKKDSFVIYTSFYKPISKLSDKQLGRLFRAIFMHQLGEVVSVEEDIEMAFEFFKNQFEIDESKYQGIVERNRENGRKGGNPNFAKGRTNPYYTKDKGRNKTLQEITEDNLTLPKITLNDNDISSPTYVVEDNIPSLNPKGFVPPSLDEMRHYFDEKGYTQEAAEKAFNYYTELGWVDSKGNRVKNWKLKCINVWFKPEYKKSDRPKRPWGDHGIAL